MISGIGMSNYPMWNQQGALGMSSRQSPEEMFGKVDTDDSGGLDQTEFQTLADMISEVSGEEVDAEELIASYDENGDGVLSEEETMAALEENRPEGSPPPEAMRPQNQNFLFGSSAGLANYLKMSALGSEQNTISNTLSIMGGRGNDANGGLFSVNTRA